MLDKIKELVADGLGVDAESVELSTSFKDDLDADSLDIFELVMSFEEAFDVKIPTEELEKINTVGDVIAFIEANQE